jgi:hypothetical protein
MQYADGELDEAISLALEKALVKDKELLSRLKIHIKTQIDLMESQANYSLEPPEQLINLLESLDHQESVEKLSQKQNPLNSSITSWLASLFRSKNSQTSTANADGSSTANSVVSNGVVVVLFAATAWYALSSQQTVNRLNDEIYSTSQISIASYGNKPTSRGIPYEQTNYRQLDDINNQLIASRGELQNLQQKLILSTSKAQVLAHEVAQIEDARPELNAVQSMHENTQEELATKGKAAQVSQEKYDNLAAALVEQNLKVAVRNSNRISHLKETTTTFSLITSVAPVISVATLINMTMEEINNYCEDIEQIIELEELVFGEVRSVTGVLLEAFKSECR